MDVHTPEQRRYNMAQIHSTNTKPETLVKKYIFSRGLRYRKNDKRYPGRPDMIFPKYRTAVFVNGCFWHKHIGCRYYVPPKSNTAFWEKKLEINRLRDELNVDRLSADGWRVIVIWECELKKPVRQERLDKLYYEIIGTYTDTVLEGIH